MPVYVPNPNRQTATPAEVIEALGAEIATRYAAAEERMMRRIRDLAVEALEDMPDLGERLKTIAALRLEGARIAEELRDPRVVAQIMAIAQADGEAAAVASLGITIPDGAIPTISEGSARVVAQLALDLSNDLDDMTLRITRWMPDIYQRIISMISPSVLLGVDTLRQAERAATEAFLARGVHGFQDQAGRLWRIGTYAEMATRTAVSRAWDAAAIDRMQGVGINLVSIIVGAGACKACAQHSGRVYSTDGTPAGTYTLENPITGETVQVTVAGTLDSARATGWKHPNCRCVVVAYLPGLSIAEGSTYDPEREAARDRLRQLERRVRDLKRKESAAFDDVTRARYRGRIREAQGGIREFVADSGLLRRPYREQLSFSDGRSPSLTLALPTPRGVT